MCLQLLSRAILAVSALSVFLPTFCLSGGQVILEEGFESGTLGEGWEKNTQDTTRLAFEYRPEYVHSGRASYRVTTLDRQGGDMGSNIKFFFLPGVDKAHFRWYGMFDRDFDQGRAMHYVFITGSRTDDRYSPLGKAGQRADGTNFFVTNLEPSVQRGKFSPPGVMGFYTYWPEMKPDPNTGKYWGNRFEPDTPVRIERGRWHCFEVMVKLNAPGGSDGEQAFWIDGDKKYHQTGLRWRDSDILRLNMLNLEIYIHSSTRKNTVWFDDVKISTEYIGPLEKETAVPESGVIEKPGIIYNVEAAELGKMDLYLPAVRVDSPRPGVLLIHGGGWSGGERGQWRKLAHLLAGRGYVCASASYRLAPGVTVFEIIADVRRAMDFFKANSSAYGVDPERIGVVGSSAGGHLAALLATIPPGDSLGDPEGLIRRDTRPAAAACYNPVLDFIEEGGGRDWREKLFAGSGDIDKDREAWAIVSPARRVSADMPPFLFIYGDRDTLTPVENSRKMIDGMKAAGVEAALEMFPGMEHGFGYSLSPGESLRAAETVADFFDSRLKK